MTCVFHSGLFILFILLPFFGDKLLLFIRSHLDYFHFNYFHLESLQKKPHSNLLPKQNKKRRVKKPDTLAGTKRHLFSSASSFFSVFIVVSPRPGSLRVNNSGCRCDTFITAMTFCNSPRVGSALLRQRQLESGSGHYQNHNSFHHKSWKSVLDGWPTWEQPTRWRASECLNPVIMFYFLLSSSSYAVIPPLYHWPIKLKTSWKKKNWIWSLGVKGPGGCNMMAFGKEKENSLLSLFSASSFCSFSFSSLHQLFKDTVVLQ